jgi:hypothetical protein
MNDVFYRHRQDGAVDRRFLIEVNEAADIRRVKRAAEENRIEIAGQLAIRLLIAFCGRSG